MHAHRRPCASRHPRPRRGEGRALMARCFSSCRPRWGHWGSWMDHLAYQANARQLFTEMVQGPEPRIDLGRAALLVASEEYPGLDVLRYVAKLEAMAAAMRRRAFSHHDPLAKIERLNAYLF